jgi:hypothetical protein
MNSGRPTLAHPAHQSNEEVTDQMDEIVNWVDRLPEAPLELVLRFRRDMARVLADADLVIARRMTTAQAPPSLDRAVGLGEACTILGTTKAWLGRKANWAKCGGYLDADRHVKFSIATLQAYLRRQQGP